MSLNRRPSGSIDGALSPATAANPQQTATKSPATLQLIPQSDPF
jgi:hypothetical protein